MNRYRTLFLMIVIFTAVSGGVGCKWSKPDQKTTVTNASVRGPADQQVPVQQAQDPHSGAPVQDLPADTPDAALDQAAKDAQAHVSDSHSQVVVNSDDNPLPSDSNESDSNELTNDDKETLRQIQTDLQNRVGVKVEEGNQKLAKKREKLLLKLLKMKEKGMPVDPSLLDDLGRSPMPSVGDPTVMMQQ